jgi:hypothetical protein
VLFERRTDRRRRRGVSHRCASTEHWSFNGPFHGRTWCDGRAARGAMESETQPTVASGAVGRGTWCDGQARSGSPSARSPFREPPVSSSKIAGSGEPAERLLHGPQPEPRPGGDGPARPGFPVPVHGPRCEGHSALRASRRAGRSHHVAHIEQRAAHGSASRSPRATSTAARSAGRSPFVSRRNARRGCRASRGTRRGRGQLRDSAVAQLARGIVVVVHRVHPMAVLPHPSYSAGAARRGPSGRGLSLTADAQR